MWEQRQQPASPDLRHPNSQQQQGNKPLFSQHLWPFWKKFWLALRGSFAEQLRFQLQWSGKWCTHSDLLFWLLCLLLQWNVWGHMIDRTTRITQSGLKALPQNKREVPLWKKGDRWRAEKEHHVMYKWWFAALMTSRFYPLTAFSFFLLFSR